MLRTARGHEDRDPLEDEVRHEPGRNTYIYIYIYVYRTGRNISLEWEVGGVLLKWSCLRSRIRRNRTPLFCMHILQKSSTKCGRDLEGISVLIFLIIITARGIRKGGSGKNNTFNWHNHDFWQFFLVCLFWLEGRSSGERARHEASADRTATGTTGGSSPGENRNKGDARAPYLWKTKEPQHPILLLILISLIAIFPRCRQGTANLPTKTLGSDQRDPDPEDNSSMRKEAST